MKYGYQGEIDILRALAVIPVILYHLNEFLAPNGYLGVDLFFVISGFVITKTILKDKERTGKIKLISFFVRRLKRIYPALIIMILVTLLLLPYFGLLNVSNFHFYVKTAITSIFGISNIFLIYKNDNYFLNEENNPFTHTWSLGVEEQFYIFYPLILFFFIGNNERLKKKLNLKFFLTFIIFLSLFLFIFGEGKFFNFYSPIIRAWELAFGCLAFLIYSNNSYRKNNLVSFSIIFLILFILIFDLKNLSYEFKTISVVLLAFVFLLSGIKSENFIKFTLLNKLLTHTGKISYSLYLWHLPIIYFSDIYSSGNVRILISLSLTYLVSHFSYTLIEQPIRNYKNHDKYFVNFIKYVPFSLVSLILILFSINVLNQIKYKLDDQLNNIFYNTDTKNYIKNKFNLGNRIEPNYLLDNKEVNKNCYFESNKNSSGEYFKKYCSKLTDNEKLFILTGDCHAAHFVPMINSSKLIQNAYFIGDVSLSVLTPECLLKNICKKEEQKRKQYYINNIEYINNISLEYSEIYLINKLFFTERNEIMNLDNYYEILKNYINKLNKNIKIIFINPTPVFNFGPAPCVILNKNCNLSLEKGIKYQLKIKNIYSKLAKEFKNVYIFDVNDALCKDNICKTFDHDQDVLLFRDNDNLSVELSKSLSKYFNIFLRNNKF